ncbi:cyclic di-GMP phosphodiesterase [Methylosoma difficile]
MPFFDWWPLSKKKKQPAIQTHASLEKVYTPASELAVGMFVVELDKPWLESNFPFQGFELKDESMVNAVRRCCDFVYIDLVRTRPQSKPTPMPVNAKPNKNLAYMAGMAQFGKPPPKLSTFEKEIANSEEVYSSAGALVASFMEKISSGGGVDTNMAKKAVAECVNSVLHSPDAVLWLSQLKHKDEYTAQHSLNVCVLSIVLGRHINLSEPNLNLLGLCGMMHDMGKMLVPLDVLNKPGALTPDEALIMQSHTLLGRDLLRSSDGMHPSAVDVAYSHHERLDGKGYPRAIKKVDMSLFNKIVTIADMYDAITSDRVYQKGRTHLEATAILWNMAGLVLDPVLVVKFIESLGVYPPGCLVEMTNSAIGIVVEVNEGARLRPKVIIILDEDKNPVEEKVLDLSQMVTDRAGKIYTIQKIVRGEDCNVDTSKYYQDGVVQKGFNLGKNK